MKTTDALVESEQFQDFLYAMQRGKPIAPCPYCGWSCVVKDAEKAKSVECQNCTRVTEIEINYVEEQEAVQ